MFVALAALGLAAAGTSGGAFCSGTAVDVSLRRRSLLNAITTASSTSSASAKGPVSFAPAFVFFRRRRAEKTERTEDAGLVKTVVSEWVRLEKTLRSGMLLSHRVRLLVTGCAQQICETNASLHVRHVGIPTA